VTSRGTPNHAALQKWVRFVDGIHLFARERREEVRFLGF